MSEGKPDEPLRHSVQMEEVLDKDVFVGFFGTLLFLAVFLNLVLLVLVLWPLNRHYALWPFHKLLIVCPLHLNPVVIHKSPKHVVLVAVCLSQLLTAFLHHSLVLHMYISRDGYLPPPVSCSTIVTTEIAAYLFPGLTRLLVAVVLVTEVQNRTSHDDVKRMMTACVLIVFSAMYVFGLLVPVFFFLYLHYATEPCYPGKNILRYTTNASNGRVLSAMSYIVPVLGILAAVALLVFVHKQKQSSSASTSTSSVSSRTSQTSGQNSLNSGLRPDFPADTVTSLSTGVEHRYHSPRPQYMPSLHSDKLVSLKRPPFPFDTLAAAVMVIVLEFVFCVRQFAYWNQADERLMSRAEWIQLWAADRFLSLLSVCLLPCCWFFDPYVREVFRRPGKSSVPSSCHSDNGVEWTKAEQVPGERKREEGNETDVVEYQNVFNEKQRSPGLAGKNEMWEKNTSRVSFHGRDRRQQNTESVGLNQMAGGRRGERDARNNEGWRQTQQWNNDSSSGRERLRNGSTGDWSETSNSPVTPSGSQFHGHSSQSTNNTDRNKNQRTGDSYNRTQANWRNCSRTTSQERQPEMQPNTEYANYDNRRRGGMDLHQNRRNGAGVYSLEKNSPQANEKRGDYEKEQYHRSLSGASLHSGERSRGNTHSENFDRTYGNSQQRQSNESQDGRMLGRRGDNTYRDPYDRADNRRWPDDMDERKGHSTMPTQRNRGGQVFTVNRQGVNDVYHCSDLDRHNARTTDSRRQQERKHHMGRQQFEEESHGVYANEQRVYTNKQGAYANKQGAYANEQVVYANELRAVQQRNPGGLQQRTSPAESYSSNSRTAGSQRTTNRPRNEAGSHEMQEGRGRLHDTHKSDNTFTEERVGNRRSDEQVRRARAEGEGGEIGQRVIPGSKGNLGYNRFASNNQQKNYPIQFNGQGQRRQPNPYRPESEC